MSDEKVIKPWWREPWPWILMAGPALAFIGCVITIVLAVQHFGDQGISDGGFKRGLVVAKQAAPVAPAGQEPVAIPSNLVKDSP